MQHELETVTEPSGEFAHKRSARQPSCVALPSWGVLVTLTGVGSETATAQEA